MASTHLARPAALVVFSSLLTIAPATAVVADPVENTIVVTEHAELPLGPNQVRFHFPPFDEMGGALELQEVTIEVCISLEATVTIENDSLLPEPGPTLNMAGISTTTVPVVAPIDQSFDCSYAGPPLAGSDGTPGSGPDFWDLGPIACPEKDTVVITSGLDAFTGPDTFDIDIFVTGGFSLGGLTDSTINIADFVAVCDVTVTLGYKTATGGCCIQGMCQELSEPECMDQGGVFQGAGVDCVGVQCPTVCPDLDGDDNVGFNDLVAVLSSWGQCVGCPADFDQDGLVGFADLVRVLSAWGACPAP